jgi:hypothetical protein
MIEWLLSIDWSWLFGDGYINFAIDIVYPRAVVSVTGVAIGKRYGEIVLDDITTPGDEGFIEVGIAISSPGNSRNGVATGAREFTGLQWGRIWLNGDGPKVPSFTNGPTFAATDVAMFAVDTANGKVWVGKVGTGWYNAGDPAAGTGQTGTIAIATYYLAASIERIDTPPIGGAQFSLRTQSSQFTGSIPSGFSAWYP